MDEEAARVQKKLDGHVEFWFNQAKGQLRQVEETLKYNNTTGNQLLAWTVRRVIAGYRQYLLDGGILDELTDLPKRVADSQRKEPSDAPIQTRGSDSL